MTEELKQKAIKASDKKCVKGCSKYYRYGFQDGYIAGAEELQEEIKKTRHLADVRCDQALENYQKWHITNRDKIDLEIKVEDLEKQIEKAKEIIGEYIRLSLQEDKDIEANVKLFQRAEAFIKEAGDENV